MTPIRTHARGNVNQVKYVTLVEMTWQVKYHSTTISYYGTGQIGDFQNASEVRENDRRTSERLDERCGAGERMCDEEVMISMCQSRLVSHAFNC